MLRREVVIVLLLIISHVSSLAHASWEQHADDMYEVLGLKRNEKLTDWMRFVSSVLIDNYNTDYAFSDNGEPFDFYMYLKDKYPGFQCKHRLLFHWGYNSRPWSPYLQEKVISNGWSESMIRDFQADLIAEQKRRNSFANYYTENVFGFAHGGKEARVARGIISIVYDVHLLGDYEPDNTDLDGLQDLGSIVGDIINNINVLDKQNGSALSKKIKKISQDSNLGVQDKAASLMSILKEKFNDFLRTAEGGNIANHLNKQGFFFVDQRTVLPRLEKNNVHKDRSVTNEQGESSQKRVGLGLVIFFSIIILVVLLVLLFKK